VNLRKTKHLVEIRNIIAHSPLALVLFQEETETPFREAIASNSDDSKIIEFEKLQETVEQAEEIVERLHQHLASFRCIDLNLYPPTDWSYLNRDT
jgi:tetrahydromethanopterin S-methyltransferase subunit B